MKKFIITFSFLFFIVFLFSGCTSSEKNMSYEVSEDFGLYDFYNKIDKSGEKLVIIYGTKGDEKETADLKWYGDYMKTIMSMFSENSNSDNIIIKSDTEVTDKMIKENNIAILGKPSLNQVFKRFNNKFPIQVKNNQLIAGDKIFKGEKVAYHYLLPNPLDSKKYCWINGALNNDIIRYIGHSFWHEDYHIKINEKEEYRGDFEKSKDGWTLSLGEKTVKDNNFLTKESKHFKFYYSQHNTHVEKEIDDIVNKAEKKYKQLSKNLGEYDDKIECYLFMDSKFLVRGIVYPYGEFLGEIYEVHNNSKKITSNKENTLLNKLGYKIYNILAHKNKRPLSRFTNDGYYLYLTIDNERARNIDIEIKKILNTEKYIPLTYLSENIIDSSLNENIVNKEEYSFTKYIIKKYGMDKYKKFYSLSAFYNLETSLYKVYNKELMILEEEWLDYVKNADVTNEK
ncbi:MAG: hypothetical protein FH751_15060 [Firmicutes bacterium]|nr:hypothetical protein [Bacillota bacterium]